MSDVMTREKAREYLRTIFALPREPFDLYRLAEVVKFLFDNLDARGRLDDEPWKGMNPTRGVRKDR